MPPNIGKTPQNQLDALPLLTPDTAAQGGDIFIVGQSVTRYFSPAALGIVEATRVADPDEAGSTLILSNQIDLRGMNSLQVVITRLALLAGNDEFNVTLSLIMQLKNSGGLFSRTGVPGTGQCTTIGSITPTIKPAADAYPFTSVLTRGLSWTVNSVAGGISSGAFIGTCRLWMRWTVPAAGPAWSAEIYAQT